MSAIAVESHPAPPQARDAHPSGVTTIPGEAVSSASDGMRGHGTYLDPHDGNVLASVAGNIERVNKLVSVKPLRARYRPEVGDLVVGRILEVGQGRWKVDCQARLDATLLLASVNLPGGVQRRKLESDELQMRTFFSEGDLLVAEVQAISGDGSISLHTRSLKYGKLRNGRLVQVSPSLIVRLKSHFHTLNCGVSLIVGLNGSIWIYASPEASKSNPLNRARHDVAFGDTYRGPMRASTNTDMDIDSETLGDDGIRKEREDEAAMAQRVYSSENDHPLGLPTLDSIARVASVITLLANNNIPITNGIIADAYNATIDALESHIDIDPPNSHSSRLTTLDYTPEVQRRILDAISIHEEEES